MAAFVSGSRFGLKAAIRIGIFLTLMLGFGSVVHWLVLVSGSLVYGVILLAHFLLKPLIVGGFVISMIRPCWQRMRSLGFPPYWGLLIPLLLLMDAWILVFLGPGVNEPFNPRVLRALVPYSSLAVLLVIAMSLAKTSSGLADWTRSNAGKVTATLGFIVLFLMALRLLTWLSFILLHQANFLALLTFTPMAVHLQTLVCALFAGAAIWFALHSRNSAASPGGGFETDSSIGH